MGFGESGYVRGSVGLFTLPAWVRLAEKTLAPAGPSVNEKLCSCAAHGRGFSGSG